MRIDFKPGKWEDKLVYAYTYRYDDRPIFLQESDHVRNREDRDSQYGFENISVFYPKKLGIGTEASVVCSFDSFGAPLITLAEELIPENGVLKYGNYYEVVLYEDGINVWKLWYDGEKVSWHKRVGVDFKVAAGRKHTLHVKLEQDRLVIRVGKHKIDLRIDGLRDEYFFGLDACEGINRFYSLELREE